jgi:hypothetical protein
MHQIIIGNLEALLEPEYLSRRAIISLLRYRLSCVPGAGHRCADDHHGSLLSVATIVFVIVLNNFDSKRSLASPWSELEE